ncbi:hypothetical protein JHK86_012391 [Glycine max]|nr:hypothetical protein JHK86_012391 [Glycine max]
MQNYQHAKRSDSAKAGINRKRIMQQKRHAHAQSSSQPTVNYTSEYDSETSDIAWSNFMTFYEDCQSPTNQPVINTENTRILHNKGNQTRHIISARHKQPHYSSTSGLEKNQRKKNLTLIEIEQPWHINQRSLKDYPTMPYPQDINLTSYLQNNLTRYPIVRPPAIIQFRAALHNDQKYPHSTMNNGHQITHKRSGSNTMEQPIQYESNNTEADVFLQMDSQTSE